MKKNGLKIALLLLGAIIGALSTPFLAWAARTATQSVGGYFAASPTVPVNVYYNSGSVGIGTSAPTSNGLSVVGLSTTSPASILKIASSSDTLFLDVGYNGTTTIKQYAGFGAPTLSTSTGSGLVLGTSTVTGTDLAGLITLITGSAPAVKATVTSLYYGSTSGAYCVFSPANAAAQSTSTSIFINASSTGFDLVASTTPLTATTTYAWSYHCN